MDALQHQQHRATHHVNSYYSSCEIAIQDADGLAIPQLQLNDVITGGIS
jgi:hypothetical protein